MINFLTDQRLMDLIYPKKKDSWILFELQDLIDTGTNKRMSCLWICQSRGNDFLELTFFYLYLFEPITAVLIHM